MWNVACWFRHDWRYNMLKEYDSRNHSISTFLSDLKSCIFCIHLIVYFGGIYPKWFWHFIHTISSKKQPIHQYKNASGFRIPLFKRKIFFFYFMENSVFFWYRGISLCLMLREPPQRDIIKCEENKKLQTWSSCFIYFSNG